MLEAILETAFFNEVKESLPFPSNKRPLADTAPAVWLTPPLAVLKVTLPPVLPVPALTSLAMVKVLPVFNVILFVKSVTPLIVLTLPEIIPGRFPTINVPLLVKVKLPLPVRLAANVPTLLFELFRLKLPVPCKSKLLEAIKPFWVIPAAEVRLIVPGAETPFALTLKAVLPVLLIEISPLVAEGSIMAEKASRPLTLIGLVKEPIPSDPALRFKTPEPFTKAEIVKSPVSMIPPTPVLHALAPFPV